MRQFRLNNGEITLYCPRALPMGILKEFPTYEFTEVKREDRVFFKYIFKDYPGICFVIKALVDTYPDNLKTDKEMYAHLCEQAKQIVYPKLFSYNDTHVGIEIPGLPTYLRVVQETGALERTYSLYTVPFSRAFDVLRMVNAISTFLPAFELDDSIKKVFHEPLASFDGKIPSLFDGDITDLYTVKHAYKAKPENFVNMGYKSPADFLITRPRRYIDKTAATDFRHFETGEDVTLIGTLVNKEIVFYKHSKFTIRVGYGESAVCFDTMFWNRSWMSDQFKLGDEVLFVGKYDKQVKGVPTFGGNSLESILEAKSLPIVPIYPQSAKNKLNTKILMNTVYELMTRMSPYKNKLGSYVQTPEGFYDLGEAISQLHFPKSIENYKTSLDTLAFFELVYLQLLIIHRQETEEKAKGLAKTLQKNQLVKAAILGLPYKLTKDQKTACSKIFAKLATDTAESMLLSADVGAGKSLVAQLACLKTVDAGYQAVLAGPTEVLAEQLYATFVKVLNGIPADIRPKITYLSGSLKAKERQAIEMGIASGAFNIIVGTHSVLSTKVPYRNLGFVCIDEQQKFGAAQRDSLLLSRNDENMPDVLTQTATPIPRSTAQIYYGDIELITINEKPGNRKPIETVWIKKNARELMKTKNLEIWEDIASEVAKNHQVFMVVPMVHENAKLDAASVEETFKNVSKVLPNVTVEFLHGQMRKPEQSVRMENFRSGKASILVASTVIEVGVDVPNATRMIILSADRLGASSLHQIRGRVGRSELESKCYLVSHVDTASNHSRLEALVDSNDGFKIALMDLKNRGEGDILGIKQSGDTSRMFASLVDHGKLIDGAKTEARRIYLTKDKSQALKDATAIIKRETE